LLPADGADGLVPTRGAMVLVKLAEVNADGLTPSSTSIAV